MGPVSPYQVMRRVWVGDCACSVLPVYLPILVFLNGSSWKMGRLSEPFVIMFTLVSTVSLSSTKGEDEATIPGDDWLDPFDMIHYENMPRERQARPQKTESRVPLQCDTPYFKKLARAILENLEERGEHEVMVKATKEETGTLRRFVDSEKGNAQDVCEVMTNILSNFKTQYVPPISSYWDLSMFSYVTKEAVVALAFLVVSLAVVIAFEARTRWSWRTQFWSILFLGFAISVPWEWYHLYRKRFASKQAKMQKDIPKHCQHDHELNPWESLVLWVKSAVTFSDDACTEYQRTLLVDPIWEVSPLKVSYNLLNHSLLSRLLCFRETMAAVQ